MLIASLCVDQPPEVIADEVGDRGSGELKARVSEALNERLRPIRKRRREVGRDSALLSAVLARGNEQAREMADRTLTQLRELMNMDY